MKYLSEYRDPELARSLVDRIRAESSRSWTLMEVCGGQTHTIVKQGIPEVLGDSVELIHGPGCPVCVTPLEQIDRALYLAERPEVIFTSFGDMLRVPGSECDLFQVRARGGEVRVVYSPLDALELARANPDREIVFFAVGFETTAPANAMAVWRARELDVPNFSVLVSHVTVPPAMTAILESPDNRVEGFLAAGHVCTVMGWEEYEPLASAHRVPIVVTGFEPVDILEGIWMAVRQLEEGRSEVENQYARSVRRDGNRPAREIVSRVFQLVDRQWRGIGEIPASGLGLRPEFAPWDAEKKFELGGIRATEPEECRAGDVLRGRIKPVECAAFGGACTPETPLGAPMVSSEGACAAYWAYARYRGTDSAPGAASREGAASGTPGAP
ncbi:MAG: hydrogenase formation protein HypD [marine benthic group bacterium]|jgi:hydrogenase expression/formation protein HypD|nr:hydrogenase formation protein HypD [Gemmatimonadota bacterium]MCL7963692.1 hydrogenase formation protein HypD [Candidatus Carthagonibacter metallireducens]MCL7958469.1 hydrogenase formation protein HypD [Gemmatimonadota bacterium]MCL7968774.1 hydrogenase formation protein HypD [Gemmatimonadota bacterium]MCL7973913.1 hydrogenase formation protein HypD [Gemmatimonadota bacterium]